MANTAHWPHEAARAADFRGAPELHIVQVQSKDDLRRVRLVVLVLVVPGTRSHDGGVPTLRTHRDKG